MTDSIFKRSVASFFLTFLRAFITFATSSLLARFLGPENYGSMIFLIASFTAIKILLDSGASSAFYTFLSGKKQSSIFIFKYLLWLLAQPLIVGLFIFVISPMELIKFLWHHDSRTLIFLAFIAVFFQNTIWQAASNIVDSARETTRLQKYNLLVVLVHLTVVYILWEFESLSLHILFIAIGIEWFIAALIVSRFFSLGALKKIDFSSEPVFRKYLNYCLPIIPYTIITFFSEFTERWMLQNWAGPSQQAFYGIGLQYSALLIIPTGAVLGIFWKEIAELNINQEFSKMKGVFYNFTYILFLIGVFFLGFLIFWLENILDLIVGEVYADALLPMTILMFYPLFQSMGQLGLSFLLAVKKSKAYSIIQSIFAILGIAVTFFLISPPELFYGLDMGASGLAIKTLLINIIFVNLLFFYISKIYDWKYRFLYQFQGIVVVITIGWLSKELVVFLLKDFNEWFQFVTTGLIYSLICLPLLIVMINKTTNISFNLLTEIKKFFFNFNKK